MMNENRQRHGNATQTNRACASAGPQIGLRRRRTGGRLPVGETADCQSAPLVRGCKLIPSRKRETATGCITLYRVVPPGIGLSFFMASADCHVLAGSVRFQAAVRPPQPTSRSASATVCPDMPAYAHM